MKKILAIGGSVIKTALYELRQVIDYQHIEMLIHNGGSIFHDFQIAIDKNLKSHSYPLNDLLYSFACNEQASDLLIKWLQGESAPEESLTCLCQRSGIPVLLFTGLGCDFWQLFLDDWTVVAQQAKYDFDILCNRMKNTFHYICMGSAVIHPEVFIKAIAVSQPRDFIADVVDFKEMYRPMTRIARFGNYYKIEHREYLNKLLSGEIK